MGGGGQLIVLKTAAGASFILMELYKVKKLLVLSAL